MEHNKTNSPGIARSIANIIQAAEKANAPEPGDYVGTDGLMYCGKCKTAKQTVIDLFGRQQTVFCMCRCRADEYNAVRKETAEKSRNNRIKDLRKAAFSDESLINCTFAADDGNMPEITKTCKRYVESFERFRNDGKGMLLYGSPGTGKTFFASCIANAVIDMGYPAMVTNFSRLSNQIQATFEHRQEIIDDLDAYSLLVIDDLGIERQSDYTQEIIYNVVDARYRAGLPLIVTTNLSLKDDIQKPTNVGYKRIYDRILEMCVPVEVNGINRRYKKIKDSFGEYKEILGL